MKKTKDSKIIIIAIISAMVCLIIHIIIGIVLGSWLVDNVIDNYIIEGNSMSPTIHDGDIVLSDKYNIDFSRYDIIFYKDIKDENKRRIGRVIGLPNEKIEIKNNKVMIENNELLEPAEFGNSIGDISLILQDDQYFILGDNREHSEDSRTLGAISKHNITSKLICEVENFEDYFVVYYIMLIPLLKK